MLARLGQLKSVRRSRGQSFVEVALVIPVLILLMAGVVEVAFLYFSYMEADSLTREAARFASARDFQMAEGLPESACTDSYLHFYYDTACFFTDKEINPSLPISRTDYADVAISVFTVAGNKVTDRWPQGPDYPDNVWSLYSTEIVSGTGKVKVPNWKLDCAGKIVRTEPFMINERLEKMFISGAPVNKGYVMVEVYYCYHHKLGLPFINAAIPNPMRMHAYTIMPAPEAIPTPTPISP